MFQKVINFIIGIRVKKFSLEEFIQSLIEWNAIPHIEGKILHLDDGFHNRTVIFNELHKIGLSLDDGVLEISNNGISVDLEKLHSLCKSKEPLTCYIFDKDLNVLTRDPFTKELSFSNRVELAVPFFKEMALSILKKAEYQDCFFAEITFIKEDCERYKVLRFLIEKRATRF